MYACMWTLKFTLSYNYLPMPVCNLSLVVLWYKEMDHQIVIMLVGLSCSFISIDTHSKLAAAM